MSQKELYSVEESPRTNDGQIPARKSPDATPLAEGTDPNQQQNRHTQNSVDGGEQSAGKTPPGKYISFRRFGVPKQETCKDRDSHGSQKSTRTVLNVGGKLPPARLFSCFLVVAQRMYRLARD
eukprot:5782485-Pleurochrysis_carterae.AAC.1